MESGEWRVESGEWRVESGVSGVSEWTEGRGEGRREGRGESGGMAAKKLEPHTEMWGKKAQIYFSFQDHSLSIIVH